MCGVLRTALARTMALDFQDDMFSQEDCTFVVQNAIKSVCTNPDVPYSNKKVTRS